MELTKDIELCPGTGCPLASTCIRAIWCKDDGKYRWEMGQIVVPCDKYIQKEYYGG